MLAAARKAVEYAPDSAEAHFALARAHFFNGDHQSFLRETALVLRLNPNDAGNIASLGMLMAFSGRWEEGVALIKKARDFNPSVVGIINKTNAPAKLHLLNGEYADAIDELRPAWEAYPSFWLNDLQAAYIYGAWGKTEEAEKAAASLLEKRPNFVIEDAVDFYRIYQFEESFIEMMVRELKKTGLPSRDS